MKRPSRDGAAIALAVYWLSEIAGAKSCNTGQSFSAGKCFEALIDGDYDEKPIAQLLREEVASAVKVGSLAALVVLGVLATSNTPVWIVVIASFGAVVLGVALHQAVMVTGVSVLRLHANLTGAGQVNP